MNLPTRPSMSGLQYFSKEILMTEYVTKKEFRDFKNNEFYHLSAKVDKIFWIIIGGLSTVTAGLVLLIARSF